MDGIGWFNTGIHDVLWRAEVAVSLATQRSSHIYLWKLKGLVNEGTRARAKYIRDCKCLGSFLQLCPWPLRTWWSTRLNGKEKTWKYTDTLRGLQAIPRPAMFPKGFVILGRISSVDDVHGTCNSFNFQHVIMSCSTSSCLHEVKWVATGLEEYIISMFVQETKRLNILRLQFLLWQIFAHCSISRVHSAMEPGRALLRLLLWGMRLCWNLPASEKDDDPQGNSYVSFSVRVLTAAARAMINFCVWYLRAFLPIFKFLRAPLNGSKCHLHVSHVFWALVASTFLPFTLQSMQSWATLWDFG